MSCLIIESFQSRPIWQINDSLWTDVTSQVKDESKANKITNVSGTVFLF